MAREEEGDVTKVHNSSSLTPRHLYIDLDDGDTTFSMPYIVATRCLLLEPITESKKTAKENVL